MEKLKYIRLQENDGTYSANIPISADAQNIVMQNGNNLQDTIGDIDHTVDGDISTNIEGLHTSISELAAQKLNKSEIGTYIPEHVESWLNTNITPTPAQQAVAIDESLTVHGMAADAKAAGDVIEISDSLPSNQNNRLWLKETPDVEYQIPTYDEYTELKNNLDNIFNQTKNIFYGNWVNATINASGIFVPLTTGVTQLAVENYFPVEASNTYIFSCETADVSQLWISEYNIDKILIKQTNIGSFNASKTPVINVESNTAYIRLYAYKGSNTPISVMMPIKTQIEKGSVPTSYLPHNVFSKDLFDFSEIAEGTGINNYVTSKNFTALADMEYQLDLTIDNGSISGVYGSESVNNAYYRTKFFDTSDFSEVRVSDPLLYYAHIFYYDANRDYVNVHIDTNNSNPIIISNNYKYVRVIGRKIDDSITDNEWKENIKLIYKVNYSLLNYIYNLKDAVFKGVIVPEYWKTYLMTKSVAIYQNMAEVGITGDAFQFITDYHYNSNVKNSPLLIKAIYNMGIKNIINGGDILNNHSYNDGIQILGQYREQMRGLPFFSVDGNHDYNPYATESSDIFTNDENFMFLYKDVEDNKKVEWGQKRNYYIDNQKQKIMYIFCGNYQMTNDDADWLTSVLNSITDVDYRVVVISHSIFNLSSQDPLTITRTTQGIYIERLCNAYNARGTVSFYSGSWNFENAKGKMACIVCGHIHMDYSEQTTEGYPIIATICDCNQSSQQVPKTINRAAGTTDEQAFDIFFINTVNKTIKTIRIGYGLDRSFTFV